MSQFVYINFYKTPLSAALTSTDTTMTVSSATGLPTLTTGQVLPLVLTDAATQTVHEIVYATAINSNTLTIERGQEGTVANTWAIGDYVSCDTTADTVAVSTGNPADSFQTNALTASGLIMASAGIDVSGGTAIVPVATANNEAVQMAQMQVSYIAALEAAPVPSIDGQSIRVLGYAAEGDGGGGVFFWKASSNATADGATVVLPTGYSGTGRWLREFSGSINPLWWGADATGITDSSVAVQNAMNASVTLGYLSIEWSPGTYLINSTINMSPYTRNYTHGMVEITTTSTTLTMLFHISTQYGNATTIDGGYTMPCLWDGGFTFYQNASGTGLTCFFLGDIPTSTTYGCAENSFRGIQIYNFEYGVTWGNQAFLQTFDQCFFNQCGAAIKTAANANNNTQGEGTKFIGCVFSEGGQVFSFPSGYGMELNFIGCSIDYNNSLSQSSGNGTYTFEACHFEWNNTTYTLLDLYDSSNQAEANFNNCVFNFAGATAANPLICQIGAASKGAFLSVYGCTYFLPITGVTLYNLNAGGSTFFGPSLYRAPSNAPGTYVANGATGTLHTF